MWDELAERGLSSLATYTHRLHQPHVSLAVAEGLPSDEALQAVGMVPSRPLRLQVEAAGVFPSGALFLACVVHQELLDEQRRVYKAVEPLTVDPWPYFVPGRWTPHVTCGMDCPPEQMSAALSVLLEHLPIEGTLDRGGVEDGTTGENWPAVGRSSESVELVPVTEGILNQLIEVAVTDAHPNEVTPPVGPGDGWTPERVEWLRAFHRDRRSGLVDGRQEETWAVVVGGKVIGAVRLKRVGREGCLETGAWLRRSARAQGFGRQVLTALVELAGRHGAREVCAETTTTNHGALSLLRQLGFDIRDTGITERVPSGRSGGTAVRAVLRLPGTASHQRA